jgi:hypothetical protein
MPEFLRGLATVENGVLAIEFANISSMCDEGNDPNS